MFHHCQCMELTDTGILSHSGTGLFQSICHYPSYRVPTLNSREKQIQYIVASTTVSVIVLKKSPANKKWEELLTARS